MITALILASTLALPSDVPLSDLFETTPPPADCIPLDVAIPRMKERADMVPVWRGVSTVAQAGFVIFQAPTGAWFLIHVDPDGCTTPLEMGEQGGLVPPESY